MSGPVHIRDSRTGFDVVVVAASFGGPAALAAVLGELPVDFPAAVLVVQHRTARIDTVFVEHLRRRTVLPVRLAREGQQVLATGVTVLPARHTGIVDGDRLRLQPAGSARSADPLIGSVAAAYGTRAIAVVLTGRLDDGAAGIRTVKRHGGRTVVEDPASARAAGMPAAALATGCVDLVLPLHTISHALVALTMAPGAADLFRVPPASWAQFVA
ncbi:chemotaxis protein CheB [Actinoplanes sp. Pm04-4]|uniref:protein-glutamate methylesterase n=1 Tax=Paractinoplanes pyxinae TaxID=2997416 RepID=A0ABT4BCC5_9ACTN|nr:chemotaxis protein CheB [Actinoplanes pyxinae]MCY1144170.1 chemotaxis protein CheB [Actinoplanes pyxinae]